MEHITIVELENGLVKLIPEIGYKLLDKRDNETYSEAVIKENQKKWFEAI